MERQLHAGYILSSLCGELNSPGDSLNMSEVVRWLSHFSLCDDLPAPTTEIPLASVLANLIARGLPTFPSLRVEHALADATNACEMTVSGGTGSIDWHLTEHGRTLMPLVRRAFVAISENDQRPGDDSSDDPLTEIEREFLMQSVPALDGEYLWQFIIPQREIASVVGSYQLQMVATGDGGQISEPHNEFFQQRVDFCLELPSAEGYPRGVVIEVDDDSHNDPAQMQLDNRRDQFHREACDLTTVRVPSREIHAIHGAPFEVFRSFLSHPYLELARQNLAEPLEDTPDGRCALMIALSPIAVARVQRAMVEAMHAGVLPLSGAAWRIAVLEQDVPCGHLAVGDLQDHIEHLCQLVNDAVKPPHIELAVFRRGNDEVCALTGERVFTTTRAAAENREFDLVIDVSVLQRSGRLSLVNELSESIQSRHTMVIRSTAVADAPRKLKSSRRIHYDLTDECSQRSLRFFLRNLFRKQDFREGQVEILRLIMANRSVIALLPTGAGKSLTYQLSALLQPGVTLVVDPLRSLMRDQDRSLRSFGIDTTTYVNSSVPASEREQRCKRMSEGWYLFVFVSPERFQIAEFRGALQAMDDAVVSYCVIDEAHCVSEWGHDFRTSYLRLGSNARKYCPSSDGAVPLVALTGTASFDVLADVQRELDITDEQAVVAPEKYERSELQFDIVEVQANVDDATTDFARRNAVAEAKNSCLSSVLDKLPEVFGVNGQLEQFLARGSCSANCGIIFCPHVKGSFGVHAVRAYLTNEREALNSVLGEFHGGMDPRDEEDLWKTQDQFADNALTLLVATKAFGMGIDKPNVRFTIHYSMPQSLEAFYQEAGRAGRDRRMAKCYVLYARTSLQETPDVSLDRETQLALYRNSFRGVDREKISLYEILSKIQSPGRSIVEDLQWHAVDHLGEDIRLKLWEGNGIQRLYVNGRQFDETYGYIPIHNGLPVIEERNVEPGSGHRIVHGIKDLLTSENIDGLPLPEFLAQTLNDDAGEGIEGVLAGMNVGERRTLLIPFVNSAASAVSTCLQQQGHAEATEKLVWRAAKFCSDSEKFADRVERNVLQLANPGPKFTEEQRQAVRRWFRYMRDEAATFKAVYRLSLIGIIDDYEVDYRTRTILATLVRVSDDEYVDRLYAYLIRYMSQTDAAAWRDGVPERRGETVLQKCLGALVEFAYEHIAKRREEAIRVMEQAVVDGLQSPQLFTERVNTYFDSRLTPELRRLTQDYSFQDVSAFLRDMDGDPATASHLRGACDRLLVEAPGNALLLLLRIAADALSHRPLVERTREDWQHAWDTFVRRESFGQKELVQKKVQIVELVQRFDETAGASIGMLVAGDHLRWLREYNRPHSGANPK